jgi:hypothetical protein
MGDGTTHYIAQELDDKKMVSAEGIEPSTY